MGGSIMQDLGKILMMPKGDYSASTAYEVLDVVNHDGASWMCKKNCKGQTPTATNADYWQSIGIAVDLSEIQSSSLGVLDKEGWYRVAAYPMPTENAGRGISSNGCTLTIKQRYSSQDGEYHELKLISVYNSQEIISVASKCSIGARNVTKARYTYDSDNAYLEIYYCRSTANSILFEVSHPKDRSSMWKAITPVATLEALDGVTVTTTYDIPANVTPATSVDLANYLPKNAPQLNDGESLHLKPVASGTNAIGSMFKNKNGDVDGGVVAFCNNGLVDNINIAVGTTSPWVSQFGLNIAKDAITWKNNNLLHTGNKPSGTYQGTGDATQRIINIGGIGDWVFLWDNYTLNNVIVGRNGAITWDYLGQFSTIPQAEIHFVEGVLVIQSTRPAINQAGAYFYYLVP